MTSEGEDSFEIQKGFSWLGCQTSYVGRCEQEGFHTQQNRNERGSTSNLFQIRKCLYHSILRKALIPFLGNQQDLSEVPAH